MLKRMLDKIFPARVCARNGHDFEGWESMGPHMNNPDIGPQGGVYYGLRYVVQCARCKGPNQ